MKPKPTRKTSAKKRRSAEGGDGVDVRDWLGNIRLSGFTLIMLGLVVLAAFVLVPTATTYIQQQQRIAVLEESITATTDEIAARERERERWTDPKYVEAQARERLYYSRPGEVLYIVNDDLDAAEASPAEVPVSTAVQESGSDWMGTLVRSTIDAGLAETVRSE